jgi:hypothetical protein
MVGVVFQTSSFVSTTFFVFVFRVATKFSNIFVFNFFLIAQENQENLQYLLLFPDFCLSFFCW